MSRGFFQGFGTGIWANTRAAKYLARLVERFLLYVVVVVLVVVITVVNWFMSRPMWERVTLVSSLAVAVVWWLDRRWGGHGRDAIRSYRAARRTAVYRFYDKHDQLLYVGVAYDVDRRLEQHKADKFWAWRITRREVEWFDSRELALDEETAWIKGDRGPVPLFNISQARTA